MGYLAFAYRQTSKFVIEQDKIYGSYRKWTKSLKCQRKEKNICWYALGERDGSMMVEGP